MKKIPQDIMGNIAILKFPKRTLWITKKLKAIKFLKQNKTVTTVLEKTDKFSGRLRILQTKYLAGIKTTKAIYKENDCTFHFDINKSYFSPRLSNERKIIADKVAKIVPETPKHRKGLPQPIISNSRGCTETPTKMCNILIMFAGISPYPIVIARKLKLLNKKALITSNELNKKANQESKKNIILNKLQNYITLINGDAKKLPTKTKQKFDIILMPRPNLKDTFLKTALKLSKKGTTIFYHGFGTKEEVLTEIKKDTKNKIGKIKIRKAGDIGPYIFRWQAQFKVK